MTYEGYTLKKDKDYTVSYSDNAEPGHNSAKLIVTGKGNYKGTAEASFTILPRRVENVRVRTEKGFVYVSWDTLKNAECYRVVYCTDRSFSKKTHEMIVSDNSAEITEGFTAGDTVYVKVCACYSEDTEQLCGPESGSQSVKAKGELGEIIVTADSWYYSGREVSPDCKVYSTQKKELTAGKDYVLVYKNNIEPGRGSITAKGLGEYGGTVSGRFDICLPKNEITSISSREGLVDISWRNSPKADGYYLLCSRDSDFSDYYFVDYDKTKTNSLIETYSLGEGTWYFKICSYVLGKDSSDDRIGVYSEAESVSVKAPELPEPEPAPVETKTDKDSSGNDNDDIIDKGENELAKLKTKIENTVSGYRGIWSVYVKNLHTGSSISVNNCRLYTASEMKLFGMTAAYQAIEDGRISESSLKDLLYDMITVSDNDAFNQIVRKIGVTSVRDWINANGYKDTYQCAGFVSGNNYWETVVGSGYNYSSVNDCGRLLETIYRGTCVSKEASGKMLDLLKKQKLTSKIPAVIPSGIQTANKTGEYMGTNHDCAIIFLDGNPYILCVFSETDGYLFQYSENIRYISSIVYKYMAAL